MRSQRTATFFASALVALALGACDSDSPTQPADRPVVLAVFTEPMSGFQTSSVLDVDGEIVRFDVANDRLIWVATGQTFDGWIVSGTQLGTTGEFRVLFGVAGGQQRAYFTEVGPDTICDISLENGQLVIRPTNVMVPR